MCKYAVHTATTALLQNKNVAPYRDTVTKKEKEVQKNDRIDKGRTIKTERQTKKLMAEKADPESQTQTLRKKPSSPRV